jgi:hypothetical protein
MPAKVPLLGGCTYALNPGPWSYKEQMLATIMFSIASGAGGTYYVYLVQMLPQYLDQQWVSFPYEVLLALAVQYFGLGFAGILRRFVIYPVEAIWPRVLPTLALNRALLVPETYEKINGWTVSRYRFFMYCFGGMFFYFWIPNTFFTGLRLSKSTTAWRMTCPRLIASELDDLDRTKQLQPRDDHRFLRRDGFQSDLYPRLEHFR